jgi:hypothetical protein
MSRLAALYGGKDTTMKKTTLPRPRSLRLGRETLRTLASKQLAEVAGGLVRLRTITCDDECDSYQCMDTYC